MCKCLDAWIDEVLLLTDHGVILMDDFYRYKFAFEDGLSPLEAFSIIGTGYSESKA